MGDELLALKESGNSCLKAQQYGEAVTHYSAALALLEGGKLQETPSVQPHIFHSNRSAAYYFQGEFAKALEDGQACIRLAPDWAKGYSRAGAALFALGEHQQAAKIYITGLTKDPTNLSLSQGLSAVQEAFKQVKAGSSEGISANTGPDDKKKEQEKEMGGKGEEEKVVIGIDLGTTYSCVSVWKDDGVVIIPNEEGNLTTPSVVGFSADGERLVGRSAQRQASANPQNTVYDIKRILGQSFDDPSVRKELKRFPFKVEANTDNKPVVVVQENGQISRYMPEQISAMVLGKMKHIAETFLGHTVTKAVVTVPAYFNDAQRQATKDAGAIAGLQVLRILNEPTAAALAYGLDKAKAKEEAVVLVFDLGGGTFDVSVLSIEGGIFQVKSTGGDTHLGGEDFDYALFDYVCDEVKKKHNQSLSSRAEKRIKLECERVKRLISTNQTAQLVLESIFPGVDLSLPITRSKFEALNKKPFQKCLDTVKQVLKASTYAVAAVDDVVLIGGSTRIPKVQEMLQAFFQGKQLCKSINPDEAVAFGAGVQGAILSGARHQATTELLLFDVTPMTLGIEVQGKIFAPIIPRNSTVPVTKTKSFTTTENYQRVIEVPIYEGERSNVEGNNLLGEFEIRDIEHAKMGVPQIEVTFSVDTNGILKVKARDKVTNSSAQTCIANNRGRLSKGEIDRMLAEAERYKDEDRKRLERVELRNEFEALIYRVKDSASETLNAKLEALCVEYQEWMDTHPNATVPDLNATKSKFEHAYQAML